MLWNNTINSYFESGFNAVTGIDEFSFSNYSTPINIPLLLIIIMTKGILYLVAVSISNPENPNALSPTIAKTYFSGWTNFAAIA